MRILCDQHVPTKYVRALQDESWVTVSTVREELSADASDAEIAAFAEEDDWIVFTNDDDFYGLDVSHGLVVYSQLEDPRPGVVVDALEAIDEAFATTTDVRAVVPDGWA